MKSTGPEAVRLCQPGRTEDWIRRQLADRQLPPGQAPVMYQRWLNLLFLHWRMEPATIQATLPSGLFVDTFDGGAWVGIVPFRMRGVRPAGWPSVAGLSNFLELNLRTYVRDANGDPGVWFYSLDANQPIAVWVAQRRFCLPYRRSRMSYRIEDGVSVYRSERSDSGASLVYRFQRTGPSEEARFGSLEFFLVERYRLFAAKLDKIHSGRVYHTPYRVAPAHVSELSTHLFTLDRLPEPSRLPDHVCCASRVDVTIYPLSSD